MILTYFVWHYGRGLQGAVVIASNLIVFALHMFSVPELLRSFFAPWRRIAVEREGSILTPEGVSALWANTISRVLGATARLFVIVGGLLFTAVSAAAGLVIIIVWALGPLLPVASFAFGSLLLVS